MNDDNLTAETIDELWCRIGILEEKVDDLMKWCGEMSYFIRLISVDAKLNQEAKEGEQS